MSRILPFNSAYQLVGKFVNIEFGNPKKLDCQGLGICNVEMAGISPSASSSRCSRCVTKALLYYSPIDQKVSFQLRRRDINDCAYARHFDNGRFRVEENYLFPASLTLACGLPSGATIKQGIYPYQERGGHLRIQFPAVIAATQYGGPFTHQLSPAV
ncbi:MAG: hypothetical protein AAGA62_19055 [Bacteroidota bacterium]